MNDMADSLMRREKMTISFTLTDISPFTVGLRWSTYRPPMTKSATPTSKNCALA
jgi:hypothetical protein